ncbi:hypothetical protein D3C85_1050130 [compost metagenome]
MKLTVPRHNHVVVELFFLPCHRELAYFGNILAAVHNKRTLVHHKFHWAAHIQIVSVQRANQLVKPGSHYQSSRLAAVLHNNALKLRVILEDLVHLLTFRVHVDVWYHFRNLSNL